MFIGAINHNEDLVQRVFYGIYYDDGNEEQMILEDVVRILI
jgi:hypothetical protein